MTVDQKQGGAWWVEAKFHPVTTEVRGIPAQALGRGWCKATEFRRDLLPRAIVIDRNGGDSLKGYSFALDGRFSGERRQTALVGVYQDCNGRTGSFFMIIDRVAGGRPKVRFIRSVQDAHPFAALTLSGSSIIVWACLECDSYAQVRWNRKRHSFVWTPGPDG